MKGLSISFGGPIGSTSPVVFIPDLADFGRAQAIIGSYMRTRLEILAARPGNPMGAEVRQSGSAVALRAPGFPGSLFNCAYGFCDDQVGEIPGLINWYSAGVGGNFYIAPGRPMAKTARLLTEAAYAPTGFHATLAGPVNLPLETLAGIEIHCVDSEKTLKAFSDVYHRGWGITGFSVPMTPWLTAPGWTLYLATVQGRPAGAAILYVAGDDAYLADATVDPDLRRRGVHRALLDRRCDDARAAGATRIYSGAEVLSASYRSMMRKGMVLLYTEAVFVSRPPLESRP
jgi:GNAT superfamily N-acetyltransferase